MPCFQKASYLGRARPLPDPPLARSQCSLAFGALKFAKLPCLCYVETFVLKIKIDIPCKSPRLCE